MTDARNSASNACIVFYLSLSLSLSLSFSDIHTHILFLSRSFSRWFLNELPSNVCVFVREKIDNRILEDAYWPEVWSGNIVIAPNARKKNRKCNASLSGLDSKDFGLGIFSLVK